MVVEVDVMGREMRVDWESLIRVLRVDNVVLRVL